jgi:5-carboxymethyl-2-hydroxymuconate isomerase
MTEYIILDKQLKYVVSEELSQEDVMMFAFNIIKDRSEAVKDELGEQFQEVVKDGFENFQFNQAMEIIKDWDYEVRQNLTS